MYATYCTIYNYVGFYETSFTIPSRLISSLSLLLYTIHLSSLPLCPLLLHADEHAEGKQHSYITRKREYSTLPLLLYTILLPSLISPSLSRLFLNMQGKQGFITNKKERAREMYVCTRERGGEREIVSCCHLLICL